VWRRSKQGGAPVMLAPGQQYPFALSQDSRAVYWTNLGSVTSPDGTLMKLAK
jgi:hypothetical protein